MTKIKAIIIEDELPARELIKSYLEHQEGIEFAGEFGDGFSGVKGINDLLPDLVFLDIQMPKLNGFEVLELIEHNPAVIFTTAYDQYAIRAFEKSAVDYLLKPFSEQRFAQAVKKAEEVIHNKQQEKQLKQLSENHAGLEDRIERVAVRSGRNIHVIPTDEIVYIEAEGDYVMIHSTKGNFLKEKTMKFFENHLPENEFVRVHRSFIINIGFVKRIEAYEKESHIVLMEKGESIKTSRSGYKALREKLSL